jgi:hypothetical protein
MADAVTDGQAVSHRKCQVTTRASKEEPLSGRGPRAKRRKSWWEVRRRGSDDLTFRAIQDQAKWGGMLFKC